MESDQFESSRRPKNLASRIFYCLLAVAFFILLLLALSSLGNMAAIYTKVKDDSPYSKDGKYQGNSGTCILYADRCRHSKDTGTEICLGSDAACQFAVSGGGIMALTALILIVLSLVKAVLGIKAFSFWMVIDLVLVITTFLIGLASSGVISAGLARTCDTYQESGTIDKDAPCCSYSVDNTSTDKIYFYENLDAAQVTSWAGTVLLFIIMILDIVVLVVYAFRRSMRHTLAGYVHPGNVPSSPDEYQDEDELPDVTSID